VFATVLGSLVSDGARQGGAAADGSETVSLSSNCWGMVVVL